MAALLLLESLDGLLLNGVPATLQLAAASSVLVGDHYFFPDVSAAFDSTGYDLRWIVCFHKEDDYARVRFYGDPAAIVLFGWDDFIDAWTHSRAYNPAIPGNPVILGVAPTLQVGDSYYNPQFIDQWSEPSPNPDSVVTVRFSSGTSTSGEGGTVPIDIPVSMDKAYFLATAVTGAPLWQPAPEVGYNLDNLITWNNEGTAVQLLFHGSSGKYVTLPSLVDWEAAEQIARDRGPYYTKQYLWQVPGTDTYYNLGHAMQFSIDSDDPTKMRARFALEGATMVRFEASDFVAGMNAVIASTTISGIAEATVDSWETRIIANTGTVSETTKTVAQTLVTDLLLSGVWDKIDRINLFAGDQLAAATVPLKVGAGNPTDAPQGFAGPEDYTETGLDGGITPYAPQSTAAPTAQWFDTGWIESSVLPVGDVHIGFYNNGVRSGEFRIPMGSSNSGGSYNVIGIDGNPGEGYRISGYLNNGIWRYGTYTGGGGYRGHLMVSLKDGVFQGRIDGEVVGSVNTAPTGLQSDLPLFIGATNNPSGISQYATNARIAGYHVGWGLTATQQQAVATAFLKMQKSLGRWVHPAVGAWQRRAVRASFGSSWDNAVVQSMSDFMVALDDASITSKIQRLNPFAGNSLSQARVALLNGLGYYATSSSAPDIDTNNGFTEAEYSLASGITKTFVANSFQTAGLPLGAGLVGGISVWIRQEDVNGTPVGTTDGVDSYSIIIPGITGGIDGFYGGIGGAGRVSDPLTSPPGFTQLSRISTTDVRMFVNGAEVAQNTTLITPVGTPGNLSLFQNSDGSGSVALTTSIGGYSVENTAFTPQEALDYYTAWETLMLALGRTQTWGLLTEDSDNLMTITPNLQWATENA